MSHFLRRKRPWKSSELIVVDRISMEGQVMSFAFKLCYVSFNKTEEDCVVAWTHVEVPSRVLNLSVLWVHVELMLSVSMMRGVVDVSSVMS